MLIAGLFGRPMLDIALESVVGDVGSPAGVWRQEEIAAGQTDSML